MSLYREGWLSKHGQAAIGSIHEPVQGGVVKQAQASSNIGSIHDPVQGGVVKQARACSNRINT